MFHKKVTSCLTDRCVLCYLCSHWCGGRCGAINITTGWTESVVTLTFKPNQSVCCCGNQVFVATLILPSENILNTNRLQCCPSGLPIFFKSFCTWCLHVLKLCNVSWPVEPVSTCMHAPEGLEAFVDDKFSTWGIAVALSVKSIKLFVARL